MTGTALAAITEEQLRAAWRRHKLRTWPATFEEAMADEQYSRLLRLLAWHMAQPRQQQAPPPAPFPVASPPATPWLRRLRAGYFDHKRAAAGDRDD